MDRMNDLLKGDPFANKPSTSGKGRRLSSSSSSSSSGSSSSSSSSGSDSSSSYDAEENIVPVLVKKSQIPRGSGDAVAGPSGVKKQETKGGKVVASGSVVNDKVRVVPIKEKKKKNDVPKKSRKKLTEKERKERKVDPTFKSTGGYRKMKKSTGVASQSIGASEGASSLGEPSVTGDSSVMSTTPLGATAACEDGSAESSYTLRERKEKKYLCDNFLFNLQHQATYKEFYSKKGMKVGKKGEVASSSAVKKTEPEPKKTNSVLRVKDPQFPNGGLDLDTDTPPTRVRRSGITADWDDFLYDKKVKNWQWVPPVNLFKHAPLSEQWEEFAKYNMLVEIPNVFVLCDKPVYWLGKIVAIAGYKALVSYETFDVETKYLVWISFCSKVPKPIGYCGKKNQLLFPPYEVHEKHPNFLEDMWKIVGKNNFKTVLPNHLDVVQKAIHKSLRFKVKQPVEVIDWRRSPIVVTLAYVVGCIGSRIHVKFTDLNESDCGFWFTSQSPSVHEIGWSSAVGLPLAKGPGMPDPPVRPSLKNIRLPPYPKEVNIQKGMMFETVHPIDLHLLAAAKVARVLKRGYFIAEIVCNLPNPCVSFILHITSPFVLPLGFAFKHSIRLVVPYNASPDDFEWSTYMKKFGLLPLDLSVLPPRASHGFVRGAKFEAIDLRQPTFLGPVTVVQVLEHLLIIHFDGWKRDNPLSFQIVDAESPDIFPCGWAQMVGHAFQSTPDVPQACDNESVSSELTEGGDDEGDSDTDTDEEKKEESAQPRES